VALRPELELGKGDGRIGRREHTEEGHAATARPSRRCAPDPPPCCTFNALSSLSPAVTVSKSGKLMFVGKKRKKGRGCSG
jgi:hypothetical protein